MISYTWFNYDGSWTYNETIYLAHNWYIYKIDYSYIPSIRSQYTKQYMDTYDNKESKQIDKEVSFIINNLNF
jgi:hypothetical protein